jgi:heme/copper-type cytochrome/quinol oxidase subunit 2
MPIVVHVVSAEDYTKWVASQPKAEPVKTAAVAVSKQ